MLIKKELSTSSHSAFIDITRLVQKAVSDAKFDDGICTVFIPHTTAGITINENADPDVQKDMHLVLDELVPWQHPAYKHFEGNSAAHLKATMCGHSSQIIVAGGQLQLGRWQGIYLAEFDGPRQRVIWIKLLG
jgi:secondary thiamine-phosphate synthase enzyme